MKSLIQGTMMNEEANKESEEDVQFYLNIDIRYPCLCLSREDKCSISFATMGNNIKPVVARSCRNSILNPNMLIFPRVLYVCGMAQCCYTNTPYIVSLMF